MAKRKRKTYKRYSPLSFISGFLCLGIAALIVATFFFPVFGYVHASDPVITFNGGDYALFGLKTFIRVDDRFDNFLSLFETYASSGASYLLKPIAQFHQYIEIGVVAFFLFAVVFAAIEALLGVFWIITGRLVAPSASKVFGWLTTVFFWVSIGLLYAYLYAYSEIIKELGESVSLMLALNPIFIGVGLFVLTLILTIIYVAGYKNRRFVKREKVEYVDELETNLEPQPQAQPAPQPAPAPAPAPQPEPQKAVQPEPQPEPASEDEKEPEVKPEVKEEPKKESWVCEFCGSTNTSKFCSNCGAPRKGNENK